MPLHSPRSFGARVRAGQLAGLALAAVTFALPVAAAKSRENVAVPTPFEVGTSPSGNYLAALVAGAERDTLAASTFFREALRADPKNPELLERAFVSSIANGNMPDAFSLAERLVARDPNSGLAHLALGIRAIKQHKWAAARTDLNKGGSGVQRDLTATLLSAWTWVGSGDGAKANALVERLRDDAFKSFRDYHGALIADVLKNKPEAKKRFEALYGAEKGTLRLVDAYGRFMATNGDREEAKRAYEAFDAVLPRHPLVIAAQAALAANKPLEPFVKTPEQGAAEVLYGLGAVGGRQGDELAAMIYLRMSLYLAPDNALALVTLADVSERLKQYEQAIDIYNAVPASSPLRTNADIQIALLLETLGKTDDASKHLQQIVSEHPRDEDALSALGNLQRSRKEFHDSIASYTKAIEASTKPGKSLWSLYYYRGISYERDKQWPLAEADFQKALSLFPDQPLVLNYLGYSWVDRGENLDDALGKLRRAVELRPNDGYIVDSLGWAHFKLGRYDEAVTELERAIDLKASDPVINDHLGDAYWKVGRKLEAKFQWNHARDLKPEPDDLKKILVKIDKGLDEVSKPTEAVAEPKPPVEAKPNGG